MNKKGFTLIESIVTFAIIAVATAMFILGFSNVVSLMSESTLIKDHTNSLYQEICIDSNQLNVIDNQNIILTNDANQSINCAAKTNSVTSQVNDFTIRLTKFISKISLDDLPDEAYNDNSEEEEQLPRPQNQGYNGFFRLWLKQSSIPVDLSSCQSRYWDFSPQNGIYILDAIKENTPQSLYSLSGDIQQYILNEPTNDQIKALANSADGYYRDILNGHFKTFWFCIEKNNEKVLKPVVYGTVVPVGKKVLILYDMYGSTYIIFFDNKIDNKDLPQGGTKYIINGIEYSRGQIQNCEFDESSSQECYFANVSH